MAIHAEGKLNGGVGPRMKWGRLIEVYPDENEKSINV
jgi:hypothetical protein